VCVVLFAKPLNISVASIKVQGSIPFTLFLKLTSTPAPKICDLCCHCFYYLCQNKISDHTKPVSDKSHIFAWNNFQRWKYQNLWHRVKELFWQVICDGFSTVKIFFQIFLFLGHKASSVMRCGQTNRRRSRWAVRVSIARRLQPQNVANHWAVASLVLLCHPINIAEECGHNVHILLYYFSFAIR